MKDYFKFLFSNRKHRLNVILTYIIIISMTIGGIRDIYFSPEYKSTIIIFLVFINLIGILNFYRIWLIWKRVLKNKNKKKSKK